MYLLLWLLRQRKKWRIPPYRINEIKKSETYKERKRLALFIGLSDGAHMDVVRRVGGLSNEQVLTNYYPVMINWWI